MQQAWSKEIHVAAACRLGPLEAALGDCDLVASQARARPVGVILILPLSNPATASRRRSSWLGSAGSSGSPS
jgi:hypothetical protein